MRVNPATQLTGLRYERKFLVPPELGSSVLGRIRHNPGLFSSLYHPRAVNNLYLDCPNLGNYFLNVHGNTTNTDLKITKVQ